MSELSDHVPEQEEWTFRRAEPTDAQSLLGLLILCHTELPNGFVDTNGTCATLFHNAGSVYETGAAVWVAQDIHNRLLGCFFLDYPNPDLAVIRFFLVHPTSKQSTLPQKMAHYATLKGQELGGRDIGLWNDDRFAQTVSVFEALGYKATGAARALDDIADTKESYFTRSLWYQPEPL